MILLDTNVVSELMKAKPAARVLVWLSTAGRELGTTTVTLAEVRFGVERLPDGRRKRRLHETAERFFASAARDIVPFDVDAARAYGVVVATRTGLGRPIGPLDAEIAAICRARGAQLATRNTSDFTDTGVELIDPWS